MINKKCFLALLIGIFLIVFSTSLFADILSDVVNEINYVRTRPQEYAKKRLEPRLKKYKGLDYHIDSKNKIPTKEGATACKECIEMLKKQKPLHPLKMNKFLCISADILAQDQAKTGKKGHVSSDGSQLQDRLAKAHFKGSTFSEVTAYGLTDAIEIVARFMIGDGVPTRGHRVNILDPDFDKAGVAFIKGGKAANGSVCVIDFGGGAEQDIIPSKQKTDKKAGSSASNQNGGKKGGGSAGRAGGKKDKDDVKNEKDDDEKDDDDGENDDDDENDDDGFEDGEEAGDDIGYDDGGDYDGGDADYGD